jgi:hypothetical protein
MNMTDRSSYRTLGQPFPHRIMQRYVREKPPQAAIAKRIGASTSGNRFYEGLGSVDKAA